MKVQFGKFAKNQSQKQSIFSLAYENENAKIYILKMPLGYFSLMTCKKA